MKDYQEALKLLQKHFPDASTSALHEAASMMEVEMPIAGETVSTAMKAESIETVDRIRQGLSAIVADYVKLPQGARGIVPGDVISRLLTVVYDLTGQSPLDGTKSNWDWRYPKKTGALDLIQGEINDMFSMHPNHKKSEFSAKVALVRFGRDCWLKITGCPARSYANNGPFFDLISDLIEFHGKTWGTERVLNAYRTFSEGE